MNAATIQLTTAVKTISDCESVIVIPLMALEEAGYIKTFTIKDGSHAKHEYHAMAQMAYFQHQDDELDILEIDPPATLTYGGEKMELEDGMILCRGRRGDFHALVLGRPNRKKLLEAVFRYCTRWIRLDI